MEIITRKEAIERGLPRYFTGKPCKHGHVAEFDLKGTCLVCKRQWDKNNPVSPEILRENSRGWRKNNPEKVHAYRNKCRLNPKWREKERKRQRACARSWVRYSPRCNLTPDRLKQAREKDSIIRAKYPEKIRAKHHRRRARKRGAEGSFTAADFVRIKKAQGGRCACCGNKAKLEADHIVPLANGGTNWPSNIQGLCRPCNSCKSNRDPLTFMQERGFLL